MPVRPSRPTNPLPAAAAPGLDAPHHAAAAGGYSGETAGAFAAASSGRRADPSAHDQHHGLRGARAAIDTPDATRAPGAAAVERRIDARADFPPLVAAPRRHRPRAGPARGSALPGRAAHGDMCAARAAVAGRDDAPKWLAAEVSGDGTAFGSDRNRPCSDVQHPRAATEGMDARLLSDCEGRSSILVSSSIAQQLTLALDTEVVCSGPRAAVLWAQRQRLRRPHRGSGGDHSASSGDDHAARGHAISHVGPRHPGLLAYMAISRPADRTSPDDKRFLE
mmetsp:Transcript_7457/g.27370  ORF Transcript_7457/g.27370 Transcript_7457/m.27370 type:complete len:279 (+) Transcript_7457:418-1254(+)